MCEGYAVPEDPAATLAKFSSHHTYQGEGGYPTQDHCWRAV